MPFELALWRIGESLTSLESGVLPEEDLLEDFITSDMSILESNWLLIGRQVRTSYQKIIDLLALDEEGTVIVIELKRKKTERKVTGQVLDYGSWVQSLGLDDLEGIFQEFQDRYRKGEPKQTLQEAFKQKYPGLSLPELDETVGTAHQLVVVAEVLDASTERIVTYLRETWGVPIRAVFFQIFKDGDHLLLTRHWLKEDDDAMPGRRSVTPKGDWNGVWGMTFGSPTDRSWNDAMKWGYIAAGGGKSWGPHLKKLKPQDRVLVYVPDAGYTAVAEVEAEAVPAKEFMVPDEAGNLEPFTPKHVENPAFFSFPDDPDTWEYLVKVRWLGKGAVPKEQAFKEPGLFLGLPNCLYRPTKSHWSTTTEQVMNYFDVQ